MADRLANHLLRHGSDTLSDENLLELLLRFATQEPKTAAAALLRHFPGIADIMEADVRELEQVDGIGEDAVLLLRLVPELQRRYLLSRSAEETRLLSSADFGHYLLPRFFSARDEMVYLLCLDGAGKVLSCNLLGHGSVNSANVPMRRLVQEALRANASGVVLAHNHPSGIALPSREDVELTMRLRTALEVMDIALVDHLVIADNDFVSMNESGYLRRF